jgi:glycosyltransferase involved in cell wall biosynthesis
MLAETTNDDARNGWIVLGSDSWIKGADNAEAYCKKNNLQYEVVWGIPHDQLLSKLAAAEGFVYLPKGGDTCPRMVIEARALGCKLAMNENVQHQHEEWFAGDEIGMLSYLYAARDRFWTAIKQIMNYSPTVSGYVTVRNATQMKYPWTATVESMLGFCDEVVVVDGGSTDGTWESLQKWAEKEKRLLIKKIDVDPDSPSFAYESDGKLKAAARSLCTSEYCWQMDADEVVHEEDYDKVKNLARSFPRYANIVSLPVIEYWGSSEKVRMDINPWKWRISRNLPNITQGIPSALLKVDEDGFEYASVGTDSCDYIDKETGEVLPHAGFYDDSVHKIRIAGLTGNEEARKQYEDWFNRAISSLPSVHHYSWYNIANKIGQYRLHWGKFWKSMYRFDTEDTAENNVMFDKPWSEVTEPEVIELSNRLAKEMGGWIFHNKVDFSIKVPHISVQRGHPSTFISYEKLNEK